MCALAATLRINQAHALGIVESLSQFTAEYAPEGHIGRYCDKQIESAPFCGGKEHKLIEALIATGWADEDECQRLLTHDWSDHAPDFVRKRFKIAANLFLHLPRK